MKNQSLTEKNNFKKTVLDNGIRVISEEIPYVRSVTIGVWITVGSRDEDESNNGVTHLIEHMVFKGTEKRSAKMIAQSLESVGGYLNAFTSKEHTCYYARILDEHIEKAVDVLSDLILHPKFDKKELEKEKDVIIEEIKNYEDEPDEIIHDEFEKILFHPHPLSFNILGTKETLADLTKNKIEDYKNKHYITDNIIVVAAGNISHSKLVDLSEKYFGEMKRCKNKYKRVSPRIKNKTEIHRISKPIQQAHICYGTYSFNVTDERRFPLLILNTLLGDGMSSRLYQNVREKRGLAYSIYSFANLLTDSGSFGVYIGTDKCKVDLSLSIINNELEKLKKNSITPGELKRTKAQVKGNMVLGLESTSNRMIRLAKCEIYYKKYQSIDSIIEKINKVDTQSIQKVAKDLFDLNKFKLIAYIPEK